MFAFRELLASRQGELAEILTSEHGKVLSDAGGEIARGLEVVEFACSLPHLIKGSMSENVSTDVDVYSVKQPLGVVGVISPFNFPAMVPMWFFPIAIATGNCVVLKPSEKDPSRRQLDGRADDRGRPAARCLQRRARRQGGRRRDPHAPRHRLDLVRRLHADRALRLRDRHRPRQAGPGARRRQEPHARAARRRPRPGRRLRRQRRLRLRRRALHGGQRRPRRRLGRRPADREDPRADGHAEDRRRHAAAATWAR